MYTCRFCINANLVKEGSFRINAKLVEKELAPIFTKLKCLRSARYTNDWHPTKLRYFHSLESVDRVNETLLQVRGIFNSITLRLKSATVTGQH